MKPGKFYCGSRRGGECVHSGRFFFRGFSQGFPGPHQKTRQGIAPSFFAATQKGQSKGGDASENGEQGSDRKHSGRVAMVVWVRLRVRHYRQHGGAESYRLRHEVSMHGARQQFWLSTLL